MAALLAVSSVDSTVWPWAGLRAAKTVAPWAGCSVQRSAVTMAVQRAVSKVLRRAARTAARLVGSTVAPSDTKTVVWTAG